MPACHARRRRCSSSRSRPTSAGPNSRNWWIATSIGPAWRAGCAAGSTRASGSVAAHPQERADGREERVRFAVGADRDAKVLAHIGGAEPADQQSLFPKSRQPLIRREYGWPCEQKVRLARKDLEAEP